MTELTVPDAVEMTTTVCAGDGCDMAIRHPVDHAGHIRVVKVGLDHSAHSVEYADGAPEGIHAAWSWVPRPVDPDPDYVTSTDATRWAAAFASELEAGMPLDESTVASWFARALDAGRAAAQDEWQTGALAAIRAEPPGDEDLIVCASSNEATGEFIYVRVQRDGAPELVEMLQAAYRGGRFQAGPLDGVRFDPRNVIHSPGDEMVMSATDSDGLAPVYRVRPDGDAEHVGFRHGNEPGQPTRYLEGKEPVEFAATPVATSTTVGSADRFLDLDEHIERGAMLLTGGDAEADALFRVEVPEGLQRSRWTRLDDMPIWDDVTPGEYVDITLQVQERARSKGWPG